MTSTALVPLFAALFVISSSSILAESEENIPTMITGISPSGFKYFSKRLKNLLTEMFYGKDLHSIVTDISEKKTYVNNYYMNIADFVAPNVTIRPVADSHIVIQTIGGMVNIKGSWDANASAFFPWNKQKHGDFEMRTNNMLSVLELETSKNDANVLHPLSITSCQVSMKDGDIDLYLSGNLFALLENVDNDVWKAHFRDVIQRRYCVALTLLVEEMDTFLDKFKNPGYHMAEDINVKYSAINVDQNEENLFVNGYVDFFYDNRKCNMPQKVVDVKKGRPTIREYMMTIWLSESVLNCFLDALHRNYQNRWLAMIDRQTPHLGAYLGTSCAKEKNCLGSIVPGLSKEFPHQFVNFYFKFDYSPHVELIEELSGVLLSTNLSVEMRLDNTDKVLVMMDVAVKVDVEPFVENNQVCGRIFDSSTLNITVTRSEIGRGAMASSIWVGLIRRFQAIMLAKVNALLVDGLPLPQLASVPLFNEFSRVDLSDGQMRISFDLPEVETSTNNNMTS